ncbi:hypothetical protein Cadr_000015685 [Camelus dromedarius]|uniref:Uncharacterized protein n=1 Tax=Camelus dromedarius TaxID=9838 RepID=A0A5N4EAM3_CAMDR|nr:hypothetical protein Cadr_000015685 [Camelus dromedarius]
MPLEVVVELQIRADVPKSAGELICALKASNQDREFQKNNQEPEDQLNFEPPIFRLVDMTRGNIIASKYLA